MIGSPLTQLLMIPIPWVNRSGVHDPLKCAKPQREES